MPAGGFLRLFVMFCGDGQCVQEDQHDHPPVEESRLHVHSAFTTQPAIPLTSQFTVEGTVEEQLKKSFAVFIYFFIIITAVPESQLLQSEVDLFIFFHILQMDTIRQKDRIEILKHSCWYRVTRHSSTN